MNNYIGNELELFKHAKNWKQYYAGLFRDYLKGDILEVGAGIGETTHLLCDGSQDSWLCLEPDKELSSEIIHKKKKSYIPSFVEVKTDTIKGLNQNKKFDCIIYIDVIEHIKHDTEELQRVKSFLKPNAHLIILVPAHNYLFSDFDKAIGHYRRYNKGMLVNVVPSELQLVKLKYLDSIGMFASLVNKWFLKQEYPELKQIKLWDKYIIPFSRIVDPLIAHSLGKTVVGIWKNNSSK
jgi:SAM-dependent methyltransferase